MKSRFRVARCLWTIVEIRFMELKLVVKKRKKERNASTGNVCRQRYKVCNSNDRNNNNNNNMTIIAIMTRKLNGEKTS